MADGTNEDIDPVSGRKLRQTAGAFLGNIPSGYAQRNASDSGEHDGTNGANARPSDAGTIDPTQVASKSVSRNPRGRGKWTAEQHAADRARRGKPPVEPGEGVEEKVAVGGRSPEEPPLPDPTILGFAAEGLGLLNIMLAARLSAPEFLAIPPDRNAMVAKAWLKFLGYYVSIAKATGPMGALAAALTATAFVYGPPAVVSMQRKRGQIEASEKSGPTEGAEAMFASAMPPG